MKVKVNPGVGLFFFIGVVGIIIGGADFLCTHLLLPQEKLGVAPSVYGILITKWFLAGIILGMILMFFLVESWVWNNWRSWNKFCCEHHEKVYRASMDLKR